MAGAHACNLFSHHNHVRPIQAHRTLLTDVETKMAAPPSSAAAAEQRLELPDLQLIHDGDLAHDVRRQVVGEEREVQDHQAGVGAAVGGERHRRVVAEVVLEVQQALREHHEVALVQRLGEHLVRQGGDEAGGHGALDDEEELAAARVRVQRHDAARGEVDARGGDAEPVHAGEPGDEGRGQADVEGVDGRSGGGQAAVVEVVGGDGALGLARVAARRVAAGQVGDAEVLVQGEGGEGQQQREEGHDGEEQEHGRFGHGHRAIELATRSFLQLQVGELDQGTCTCWMRVMLLAFGLMYI
jgi:hypothetical protein